MRDSEANTQIVVAYYEAARAELVQRLERRDSVVVLYVGAIGAIGGAAATGAGLADYAAIGRAMGYGQRSVDSAYGCLGDRKKRAPCYSAECILSI